MRYIVAVAVAAMAVPSLLVGCGSAQKSCGGTETAVLTSDLPAAVRATLDRESAGGKVTEVEKEIKNGRTIYSADMVVNGVAWDIAVGEDGSVISRERERPGEKEKDGE